MLKKKVNIFSPRSLSDNFIILYHILSHLLYQDILLGKKTNPTLILYIKHSPNTYSFQALQYAHILSCYMVTLIMLVYGWNRQDEKNSFEPVNIFHKIISSLSSWEFCSGQTYHQEVSIKDSELF